MCDPGLATTEALKDVGSMVAVLESIEYPIETAGTPPHVLVLATNLKGEVSTAPLEGVTTVMADADIDDAANAKTAKK
jgi:hypothetical protein